MNRPISLSLLAAAGLALAACSDASDDVVQQPAPGAPPEPVSETRADTAQTTAAFAFGMTRQDLEDADLLSDQRNTDLGDVETLVLDANGQLTHVVVELEGPGDRKVVVPIANLSSRSQNDGRDKDLTTTLSVEELSALPAWTPPAR